MNGTFDIVGQEETQTSIARNSNSVRLTYKDENGNLILLEKLSSVATTPGCLLKPKDNVLLPTNDRFGSIAKLLAQPSSTTQTKTQQFGYLNKTLYLLPVSFNI